MDSFIFFLKAGFFHVLDWRAYDPILFLIALAVVYDFKNWKSVLWLITLFTIAHSLTLILAIYNVIIVSEKWIKFLIPLTIIIMALVNILYGKNTAKQTKSNTNLIFALFFGLIHGLGFSSYFQGLLGKTTNKFLALLEVALGIQLGQIVVVLFIVSIGFLVQKVFRYSKKEWILIVSSFVIGITLPLLIGRIFW